MDVVYLRRLDEPPGIVATGDQLVPLQDQLAELDSLRQAGKLGAIGLSNVSLEQLDAALPAGIACVQNRYSAVDRDGDELLGRCLAHEIAWVPFFPLGSAFPGARRVVDLPAVAAIAERLGVSPAQVGLAWLLHRAPNVLLIPGTADREHLEANLASGAIALTPEDVAAIGEAPPADTRR